MTYFQETTERVSLELEVPTADRRRVAACLSACAGIATEVLEAVKPGTLVVAVLVEREEVRR